MAATTASSTGIKSPLRNPWVRKVFSAYTVCYNDDELLKMATESGFAHPQAHWYKLHVCLTMVGMGVGHPAYDTLLERMGAWGLATARWARESNIQWSLLFDIDSSIGEKDDILSVYLLSEGNKILAQKLAAAEAAAKDVEYQAVIHSMAQTITGLTALLPPPRVTTAAVTHTNAVTAKTPTLFVPEDGSTTKSISSDEQSSERGPRRDIVVPNEVFSTINAQRKDKASSGPKANSSTDNPPWARSIRQDTTPLRPPAAKRRKLRLFPTDSEESFGTGDIDPVQPFSKSRSRTPPSAQPKSIPEPFHGHVLDL